MTPAGRAFVSSRELNRMNFLGPFTDGLARLTGDEQKAVETTATSWWILRDPSRPRRCSYLTGNQADHERLDQRSFAGNRVRP